MKTMKDYSNQYLKRDVLLLADVFKIFRDICLIHNYGLCSSHYWRAPALGWVTVLNMIKVELNLILDVDMFMFIEKRMRDGVSYISK